MTAAKEKWVASHDAKIRLTKEYKLEGGCLFQVKTAFWGISIIKVKFRGYSTQLSNRAQFSILANLSGCPFDEVLDGKVSDNELETADWNQRKDVLEKASL